MMWYLLHASIIFAVVASNINFEPRPSFFWMGRQYKPKFCPLKLYYYQLIEGVENGRVVGSTENRIAETARASSGSSALPRRPAGTIGTISAFRNQTLGTHIAGRPKQVRADLALFEGGDEDALGATDQEPRQNWPRASRAEDAACPRRRRRTCRRRGAEHPRYAFRNKTLKV